MSAVAARVEKNVRPAINGLYLSAPESTEVGALFDIRVRGDWVTTNLFAQSNLHLLLGILADDLPAEGITAIRRGGEAAFLPAVDHDDIQIEVLDRIFVVIARGTASPPAWPEIVNQLQ